MLTAIAALAFQASITVDAWTEPVGTDADDPAIVYRGENSLIIGTDKTEAPGGGLAVFNLDGKKVSGVTGLNRPNNVDVVQAFSMGSETVSLAVATERESSRLIIYSVSADGTLKDLTGRTALVRGGKKVKPMGVAVSQRDGRTFVFITPKEPMGVGQVLVGELRLDAEKGRIDFVENSWFGSFSGKKETESVAVEPSSGTVFYSDEGHGIWRYPSPLSLDGKLIANPKHTGDHEGLAFLSGYLVSTDQRVDNTVFWVYDLATLALKGSFSMGTDETDGIEICAMPMGAKYPEGIMVAMNSKGKNFAIVDVRKIKKAVRL